MPLPRQTDLLNSQATVEIPSSLQNRYEYNGDGTVLYAGHAIRGAATSDNVWTIFWYQYTSQQVTYKSTAYDSWDNRAIASYS